MKYILLLFCLFLSACGFHMRSSVDFPTQLRQVYFSSVAPYGWLSVQLKELLSSVKVKFSPQQKDVTYSIRVTSDDFSDSKPSEIDATLPTAIEFTKSTSVEIINNHTRKVLIQKSFSVSESLTLNANQIYANNANAVVKQTLNRELISLIYYWLISTDVQEALADDAKHSKKSLPLDQR